MSINLRYAIIISIGLHLAAISPLYGFGAFNARSVTRGPIVVDYVVVKDPRDVEIGRSISSQRTSGMKRREPVKKENSVKTASKDGLAAKASAKVPIQDASGILPQSEEARIRATKDYISYYDLIRERIRARLRDRYKTYKMEGDVRLIFVLSSNGALLSVRADESASTNNQMLLDLAIRSVREAAPFEPFPKALSLPKMSFDLIVTFTK